MIASYKFVQKLWLLHSKILERINDNNTNGKGENLTKFTNQLVHKVTQNLEKFHYNVIVANLYEMYNFLIKEIQKPLEKEILVQNYRKILVLMSPFIPHFASECLNNIEQKDLEWPIVSKEDLIEENINFVVQINGKKRSLLRVKRDSDEASIMKEIQLNEETKKFLKSQKIRKTIFVSNRLINIIV